MKEFFLHITHKRLSIGKITWEGALERTLKVTKRRNTGESLYSCLKRTKLV